MVAEVLNMVIIIGGGPAGLMAAIAASRSHEVVLLEKKEAVGRKLLLTGNGRCNITNNQSIPNFIKNCYGEPKFLFSHLHQFGPKEIIQFLETQGCTVVLDGDRYYPQSMKARDVLAALEQAVRENAQIQTGTEVLDFVVEQDQITKVVTKERSYECQHVILATGGLSYPQTGSTGDGFKWLKTWGHQISDLFGSEVGLIAQHESLKALAGLSLRKKKVSLKVNGRLVKTLEGDILFTHVGLSGPAILDLSHEAQVHLRKQEKVEIEIELTETEVDYTSKKTIQNQLESFLPKRLAAFLINELAITGTVQSNQVRKEQRLHLAKLLSGFSVNIEASLPIEQAVVTAGGLKLSEVDPKTLRSKHIKNLTICGELLNVIGPVGGYNLTIALSTGYVAGSNLGL